ncbi:flagellar protein FlgN [Pseudobacteroides cellulosolvens]|uniref:FlgN family protein n=1 Tax=Pseudobacteroides cellulosolvens ATCC 35603 = DSM 2933 TaxID=398512 RepID=A0A0L6JSA8_9FIRM|nr:flagellar protein FlgN [Pseudobacteroides cellulosolvens]KNY28609.1 FlgN family protein [Pseudobacteroides cellulosolvens ATCC 35603 = DSM 2933]
MDNTNKSTFDKSPEAYIERLLEITDSKYTCLQEMLELTNEQANVIDGDQIARLEEIIDSKQKIIEKVDKLDDEFEVYFHRLKSEAGIKSVDELKTSEVKGLKELKKSVSNVMGILKELSDMEKSNGNKAKKVLGDIGNELKNINVAKKVNSAYGSIPLQTESYFIDKKK